MTAVKKLKPAAKSKSVSKPRAPRAKKADVQKDEAIKELARTLYTAAKEAKAVKPVVLDVTGKVSFADYLIVASGTNERQVRAMGDRLKEAAHKKCHRKPLGIEGSEGSTWVLIDFGDVVCHLFNEESRNFYRIEDIWHDAKKVTFRTPKK